MLKKLMDALHINSDTQSQITHLIDIIKLGVYDTKTITFGYLSLDPNNTAYTGSNENWQAFRGIKGELYNQEIFDIAESLAENNLDPIKPLKIKVRIIYQDEQTDASGTITSIKSKSAILYCNNFDEAKLFEHIMQETRNWVKDPKNQTKISFNKLIEIINQPDSEKYKSLIKNIFGYDEKDPQTEQYKPTINKNNVINNLDQLNIDIQGLKIIRIEQQKPVLNTKVTDKLKTKATKEFMQAVLSVAYEMEKADKSFKPGLSAYRIQQPIIDLFSTNYNSLNEEKEAMFPDRQEFEDQHREIIEGTLKILHEKMHIRVNTLKNPNKTLSHSATDALFYFTAASVIASAFLSAANIKPIKAMLQNRTAKDMVSPLGKALKKLVDVTTRQIGGSKSICLGLGLMVCLIGAAYLRGKKREELKESKDKFWQKFAETFYEVQTEVVRNAQSAKK